MEAIHSTYTQATWLYSYTWAGDNRKLCEYVLIVFPHFIWCLYDTSVHVHHTPTLKNDHSA